MERYKALLKRINKKGFTEKDIDNMAPDNLPIYRVKEKNGAEKILYSEHELKHLKQDFFSELSDEVVTEEEGLKIVDLWELKPREIK